jgi:2-methylcitrate dehydratase PrpD
LLALAPRQPLTGKEMLHALILGIEVQCRVGNILCVPPATCAVGLSTQGLLGGIGAAVAAAKIMGLDESGITAAIGLAANQSSGLREAQSSMGSHFTPGNAARCGLLAAMLAARGFNCTESMIEGAKGFAASFASQPNLDAAIDQLGQVYEISTLAYKPYPSGVVIHSIIDACLEIVKGGALEAGKIERIELTVNPLAVKLTDIVDPRDRGQALVSLQHWAAVTLLQGAAGIEQVTDACVRDAVVSQVRRAVVYTATDSVPMEAADVCVVLKDGNRLQASVKHCRGSTSRPLTDEDITAKTRGLLRTVYADEKANHILDQSWRIEACPRVDEFCKELVI